MEELFGKVDNLNMFVHPKFNEKFKFMNDKQSVNLAKNVLSKFIKSGYKTIVVIESGTSPLISIMKKLKEYENADFNLIQIKIPRNLNFNLYEWFTAYLTSEELSKKIEYKNKQASRCELLKKLCEKFNLEKFIGQEKFTIYDSIKNEQEYDNSACEFIQILKGTKLYEIFNNEFLLFDEYINAGTIIRNFNGIVRLFTVNPKFKLSAYCMFLDNPKEYEKIAFTLYDNSTELECYRNGAYPFENRIDLIGYYYFITENVFEKVYLTDLEKEIENFNKETDVVNFYNNLNNMIIEYKLLNKLKDNLKEEQVQKYVTNNDIIRFIFKYIDKKLYGKNRYADFLDQVFELYAPSWSPMPVIFHLDYWNGFEQIKQEIDKLCSKVEQEYKLNRFEIIKSALNLLKKNRQEWLNSVNKEIEE